MFSRHAPEMSASRSSRRRAFVVGACAVLVTGLSLTMSATEPEHGPRSAWGQGTLTDP